MSLHNPQCVSFILYIVPLHCSFGIQILSGSKVLFGSLQLSSVEVETHFVPSVLITIL